MASLFSFLSPSPPNNRVKEYYDSLGPVQDVKDVVIKFECLTPEERATIQNTTCQFINLRTFKIIVYEGDTLIPRLSTNTSLYSFECNYIVESAQFFTFLPDCVEIISCARLNVKDEDEEAFVKKIPKLKKIELWYNYYVDKNTKLKVYTSLSLIKALHDKGIQVVFNNNQIQFNYVTFFNLMETIEKQQDEIKHLKSSVDNINAQLKKMQNTIDTSLW